MSNAIRIVATVPITEGQLETFRERAVACIDYVRDNEPGMLVYDWYISEDGTTCRILEEYANGDAFAAHVAGEIRNLIPKVFEVAGTPSLEIYADPATAPEQIKQMAARNGGIYTPIGGIRQG